MRRLLARLTVLAVASLVACGRTTIVCDRNDDCRPGSVCVAGTCETSAGVGGGGALGGGGDTGGGSGVTGGGGGGVTGGGGGEVTGGGGEVTGGGGEVTGGGGEVIGGGGGEVGSGGGGGIVGGGGGDVGAGGGGGITGGGGGDIGAGGGVGGDGGSACIPGEALCPGGCADLSTDVDNCGQCGRTCPDAPNGVSACSAGTCELRCDRGFGDCDLNPLNGCETELSTPTSCGQCRNVCPAGARSTATCAMGVCGLSCSPGFGDCDSLASNGCEVDLASQVNCGSCGNACGAGANQLATCSLGTCGVQCQPGFADCDGSSSNGCESSLEARATCGSCTNSCRVFEVCTGGACTNTCPAFPVGVLPLNATVSGTLPYGSGRFAPPTCHPQSTGYEDFWTLTISTPMTVVFQTGGPIDTVLVVRSSCTTNSDLHCDDNGVGLGGLSRIIATLQPGDYTVLVKQRGSAGSGGPYSLSATAVTVANALCPSAATELLDGVPVVNESSAAGIMSTNCVASAGGRLFYRVLVQPSERASITMTPTSSASMRMQLDACSSVVTVCSPVTEGVFLQVLDIDNTTLLPRSYLLSVSATTKGQDGTFDIVANKAALQVVNDQCNTPRPLPLGVLITGEDIDTGGPPELQQCMPAGQTGRRRYYSVVVPPASEVTVTATPDVFDLSLRAYQACGIGACIAYSNNTLGVGPESLRIMNPLNQLRAYIVAAASSTVGSGGTYSIVATTSPP